MLEPTGAEARLIEFCDRLATLSRADQLDSLAATDLTLTQIKVVFTVGTHAESPSVNDIADHINLSLAATGRSVEKLVGLGLVDRREDPHDRRIKRVTLTEAGSEFVESHLTVREELVTRFIAGLPESLREGLSAALAPILEGDTDYFDLAASHTCSTESRPGAPTPDSKVTA